MDLTKSRNLIIAAVIFVCGLGFSSTGGITFTVGSASHHPDRSGHRRSGGRDPQRRSPRQRLSVRHRSRGRQVRRPGLLLIPIFFHTRHRAGAVSRSGPVPCIFLIAAFPWAASACRPDGSGSRYRTHPAAGPWPPKHPQGPTWPPEWPTAAHGCPTWCRNSAA